MPVPGADVEAPEVEMRDVSFTIPKRGDKAKLLEVSERNAKQNRLDDLKHMERHNPEERVDRLMERMKNDFRLNEYPRHIECFDNSNIQGTNPVASCVVFRDGVPSKKDYRHFNIKTVVGANDYASMKEVVNRRYSRMLRALLPLMSDTVPDNLMLAPSSIFWSRFNSLVRSPTRLLR